MAMKFGLGGLQSFSINKALELAVFAEDCGFDCVTLADHINTINLDSSMPEAWTLLAAIAAETHSVKLFCVTDPIRRHPAQTAQIVSTLDQLSNGRAGVVMGAGESMNLLPFGMEWRSEPLLRLREAVEVLKLLLESSPKKTVDYNGKHFQMRNAFLQVEPVQKPRPPIQIGALGPRNREIAGEIADGWRSWLQTKETLAKAIDDIKRGLNKAERRIEDFVISMNIPVAISDDPKRRFEVLMNGVREQLVLERRVLRSMGVEIPRKNAVQWALPTIENFKKLIQLKTSVPDEAVKAVSIYGNTEDCIEKIEELSKLGVNTIIVGNYGPDYKETLRIFKRNIIPYFK